MRPSRSVVTSLVSRLSLARTISLNPPVRCFGCAYDGALDEDTWVAIGGYGPTKATVIDGGELFGRSR